MNREQAIIALMDNPEANEEALSTLIINSGCPMSMAQAIDRAKKVRDDTV